MTNLDFLNKNTRRVYPMKGPVAPVSVGGISIPTDFLVACRITTVASHEKLAISHVTVAASRVVIRVVSEVGGDYELFGTFTAEVTKDYQSVKLVTPFANSSGSLTFGKRAALLAFQGVHVFSPVALLEESCYTYITTPALKEIILNGKQHTGRVVFEYLNVRGSVQDGKLQLEALNKEGIRLVNDRSAGLGNCRGSVVGSINGVLPDEHGNIDLFAIAPLQISISNSKLAFTIQGVSRDSLCNIEQRIPPDTKVSTYLNNILTTKTPEWVSW